MLMADLSATIATAAVGIHDDIERVVVLVLVSYSWTIV